MSSQEQLTLDVVVKISTGLIDNPAGNKTKRKEEVSCFSSIYTTGDTVRNKHKKLKKVKL